jgi:hypothetical protein
MSRKSILGTVVIVALLFAAVTILAATSHSPPGVIGYEAKIMKNVLAIDFQSVIVQPGAAAVMIGGMPTWALPEGAMGLRSHAAIGQRVDYTYSINVNDNELGIGLYKKPPIAAVFASVEGGRPLRC